jgi:hypothetical protein
VRAEIAKAARQRFTVICSKLNLGDFNEHTKPP